jgi:integrase
MRKRSNRIDALGAKKRKRLPTVLTRDEVHRVLAHLSGVNLLMARLLYGSGLRLMECLRPRVKDLDDDLYPRPQSGRPGRPQPLGLTGNSGLALQSPILTTGVMNWAARESAWRRCRDSLQVDGHTTAYMCIDPVCRAPVTEPEPLLELIE